MAGIDNIVSEANVDALHKVTLNGKTKFLCFTRIAGETWILAVTDGVDIWRTEMDFDELDSHRDLSGIANMDAFLNKFRSGFTADMLSVSRIGTKVTLTVGSGTSALNFDLYEAKAIDKKSELQTILFRLADISSSYETKLNEANVQINNLKAQKGSAGGKNALFDLAPKKGGNQAKVKPKKTGMSVLNPTSRKRKAAKGVEFD